MSDTVKNFAYSTTTASVTDSATTFSVQSGHGSRFPATGSVDYNLCVYNPIYPNAAVAYQNGACEIVRADALTTDTFTNIIRAQEGTTAIAWGAGWRVELNVTAKNFEEASTTVSGLVSISQQSFSGQKTFVNGVIVGNEVDTEGLITVKDGASANSLLVYSPSGGLTGNRTQYWQDDDGTVALTKSVKSLLVFGGTVVPSVTRYAVHGAGDATVRTNEYEAQIPVGEGVIKNLRVWICANVGVTNYVVTVRKNGVDQTLTVSCNTNTTTGTLNSDTTHSFTTASGDLISVKIVTGTNGAFTPAFVYYTMEFCGA